MASSYDTSSSLPRLYLASGLLAGVVAFGTLGYMLIERWSFIDALFMTLTTITTIGFQIVHPLSMAGTIYTLVLIAVGVGVALYCLTIIGSIVVEGELHRLRGFRKMERKIQGFVNHTIVCGFGRLARITVAELMEANQPVVVIDRNPDRAKDLEALGVPYVIGSASEDATLKSASIEKAGTLLSLLPDDADNVYVILCARDLNPALTIVSRTEGETSEKKLLRAGANRVISPYRVAGVGLVQRLIRPHVTEFLEIAGGRSGESIALEEVVVPKDCRVAGLTLEESELRSRTGALIAAIITPDGQMVINPEGSTRLMDGSTLIVLGKSGSLDKLSELLDVR